MNRDSNNKLIISSPLEAHKPHTLTLDMCALDNGLENPQFACLEIDYGEADSAQAAVVTGEHLKTLVVYEVDLGLNHVVRKFAEPLPRTAHALIPVPGGDEEEGASERGLEHLAGLEGQHRGRGVQEDPGVAQGVPEVAAPI